MLWDAGPSFKKSLVTGGDILPAVPLPDARPRTILPYGVTGRIVQNRRQQAGEGLRLPDVERQGDSPATSSFSGDPL